MSELIPISVTISPEVASAAGANIATAKAAEAGAHADASEAARDAAQAAQVAIQPVIDDLANILAVRDDLPQINGVYDKLVEVNTVFTNIANVNIVAGDTIPINALNAARTELLEIHAELAAILNLNTNLAHVTTVEAALAAITTVSNAIANVNAVADNEANINTVAGDLNLGASSKTKIVADNIADVQTAADNIAAIQAAPSHASTAETQAGIATSKASEASGHADDAETAKTAAEAAQAKAEEWAEKAEDVEIEAGQYSAKHHALKADASAADAAASAAEAAGYAGYPLNFIDDNVITLSERSITDGAVILRKLRHLQKLIDDLTDAGIKTDLIDLLWLSDNPAIVREDGVLKYYRKGLDAFNTNDLDGSETASQQPRLVGGIAPNSKPAAANLNGESRRFTHPEISFGAGDAWSVTTVFNWNGTSDSATAIWGKISEGWVGLKVDGVNRYYYFNAQGGAYTSGAGLTNGFVGKNEIITIYGNNGILKIYRNGIEIISTSVNTAFNVSSFMYGRFSHLQGKVHFHIIQSQALTPTQVADLHTTLRAIYPEIESVDIGTQTWATRNFEAVASSNGTVIPQATTQATWTTGASGWSYHNEATPDTSKPDNGAIYGKLYNKAARNVIVANPPSGWHVATEAELTALAALGGNALKYSGTDYWSTTGGTNTTGFTALGGSSRNADGSFNSIKETASFWCADSDKVLKLHHDSNIAEIVAAAANEGHAIRLIKD